VNLLSISLRNLRQRALANVLTTLSIAVGTGLIAALWLLIAETDKRYKNSTRGYGAIVGPKEGAPLSLVLNSVFNLGAAPGVVPLSVYDELHDRQKKGTRFAIRYAIPQARGDHYRGFPIVGTTDEMFSRFARGKDADGQPLRLRFARGRPWTFGHDELMAYAAERAAEKSGAAPATRASDGHDHTCSDPSHHHGPEGWTKPSRWHEAVIGAEVGRKLDLRPGAVIFPVHGAEGDPDAHVHAEDGCEVVGILEPTGTPIDRVIYVPLRTFVGMDKHDAIRAEEAATAGDLLLTAIVVDSVTPNGEMKLRHEFQTRRDAQVAWPDWEVRELLSLVGNATDILRVVSWLVIAVGAVTVCVALYNTMNERRREIAIMRSLGARRLQIGRIILQEALLVALGGALLGVAACHAAAWALAPEVARRTSVAVDWAAFSLRELWLILGVGALGGLAGLLPAIKGSLTEVADNLAPTT
jgi:putative ABC transport system permease protein